MNYEVRPWGEFQVLDEQNSHKAKRITVKSGGRLSYQYHHHRAEVWTVVQGVATVTLNGVVKDYPVGSVIQIAVKEKHRVENKKDIDLVFIEVQYGESFEESDIVRIEDDYNRV